MKITTKNQIEEYCGTIAEVYQNHGDLIFFRTTAGGHWSAQITKRGDLKKNSIRKA